MRVVHTVVFRDAPGGGNACAVVFGAHALPAEGMQMLAAGWAQETAFVLAPEDPAADIQLRFFLPNHESEMCVHATVASVTALVRDGLLAGQSAIIETIFSLVPVSWSGSGDSPDVTVEQLIPEIQRGAASSADVARVLGIAPDAIAEDVAPIARVSTARTKLMVPIRAGELDRLRPRYEELWELCERAGTTGIYAFTVTGPASADARQFPRRAGFDEDAATGVAASALGAYLFEHEVFGPKRDGVHEVRVHQGRAMGRPSRMLSTTEVRGGAIVRVTLTGQAVIERVEEL